MDAVVHFLGLLAAPLAIVWFFASAAPELTAGRIVTGTIYCCGLIGMLTASALYIHGPDRARQGAVSGASTIP